MAAYCEISDLTDWILEDALVELVTDNEEASLSDEAVTEKLNKLISAGGAFIDMKLIGRYGEQLRTSATVAPLLAQACARLAVYYAYLGRQAVDDDWRQTYEDIRDWLTDLMEGKGDVAENEEGADVDETSAAYLTDAQNADDDSLNANDRRLYKPSRVYNLFGIPERD